VQKQTKRKMKMKRLIIVAFAVAFAAATQAASVAWGGYVANDARSDETAQAGTDFNAVFIGSNDYSAQLSTLIYDTATGLVGTGTGASFKALTGQTLVDTHTLTASEAGAFEFADTIIRADADGGVSGNWLITMYDATSPDSFWVGQYNVSGVTDLTTAGSIVDTSWSIGYGMQSGVTQSVPEPTSGLLMLVGLAGLALRRRRA
jgi:hypothetical protein